MLIMFLVGCSSQPNVDQTPIPTPQKQVEPEPIPTPVETATQPEPEPVVEKETKPVVKANAPEWDALLARHPKIKTGYMYDYSETDDSLARQSGNVDNVIVVNDKIKVSYFRILEEKGFKYNYLYLNDLNSEAFLYCEELACKDLNGTAKKADFEKYRITTPIEHLLDLYKAKFVMDQQYDDLESVVLKQAGDETLELWVYEFYGIPLKVEKTTGESKVVLRFDNVIVNKYSQSDVTLPGSAQIVK